MKIWIRRNSGGGAIIIIVILGALGLGGCAAYKIIKKTKKIEERRRQQESNALAEAHFQLPPTSPFSAGLVEAVAPPIASTNLHDGFKAHAQVNTNYYNEALEDESGF